MDDQGICGATGDLGADLHAQLRDLIPGAFPDGSLDVAALLAALDLSTEPAAGFTFAWPGIEKAREAARAPTTATLVPDEDASVGWEAARDVLIEGDNLQVLKLLKRGYAGAAKLIYIDPPYNTGKTFTYNDDFSVSEQQYLIASGQMDEQGATTSRLEKGGRKHAPWLSFMFPRLAVARHLLRRDGVIIVSIDNNEVHHLRLLLDALFGAANFVDMITWQGGRKGDARLTAGGQDYLLIYARDRSYLKQLNTKWRERKTGLEEVYETEKRLLAEFGDDHEAAKAALRQWYDELPEGNPSKQHAHYDRIDKGGVWTSDNSSSPNYRENLKYEFNGYPPPENGWRYERTTMEKLDVAKKLIYPTGKAERIRIKKYLHEQEYWAPASSFYRDRSGASAALEGLLGAPVFDNPKNTDVLARFVGAITGEDDLIVDFFAGSGSTGQAVWEQVRADKKARRWLLVQAPELPDETEPSGKAAIGAGFSTIFEITAERLRQASAAIEASAGAAQRPGFRVFRASETHLVVTRPILATADITGEEYMQLTLAHMDGPPVKEGANALAVAWEVVLKSTDLPLDAAVKSHVIDGVEVFEFSRPGGTSPESRLFVSLGQFTLSMSDTLGLKETDTLILRGDVVEDSTTLTLAPRLQSKLLLIERVPREVSL